MTEFERCHSVEYLPPVVREWWNSLTEEKKAYWLKIAEIERKKYSVHFNRSIKLRSLK